MKGWSGNVISIKSRTSTMWQLDINSVRILARNYFFPTFSDMRWLSNPYLRVVPIIGLHFFFLYSISDPQFGHERISPLDGASVQYISQSLWARMGRFLRWPLDGCKNKNSMRKSSLHSSRKNQQETSRNVCWIQMSCHLIQYRLFEQK